MTNTELHLLRQLAKAWNKLDTTEIADALAEDMVYESQWVMDTLRGKTPYLHYLQRKFDAIRGAAQGGSQKVVAEIAYHPSLRDRPIIVLTQIDADEVRRATILIEVADGLIRRIDTCFIPDPNLADLTGEFPR